MFAGAGHGSYLPMKLFCPYNMIARQIEGTDADGTALDPMAFMVYGASICGGWSTAYRRKILAVFCIVHFLAVGICFFVAGSGY